MEIVKLSELEDRGVPLARWLRPEHEVHLRCERCKSEDVVAPLAPEPGDVMRYGGATVVCIACGVVHEGWVRTNGTVFLQPCGLLSLTALAALRRLLGRPRSTWWTP